MRDGDRNNMEIIKGTSSNLIHVFDLKGAVDITLHGELETWVEIPV